VAIKVNEPLANANAAALWEQSPLARLALSTPFVKDLFTEFQTLDSIGIQGRKYFNSCCIKDLQQVLDYCVA
jgi:hypothetical protein